MGKKAVRKLNQEENILSKDQPIDCACVIHGNYYSFDYVDKLYRGICNNISRPVNLHVYTEADRSVPAPYIHHPLRDLGVRGPRKGWWYKTELFNPKQFYGQLLYFDLDVVITGNIDFFLDLSVNYFWGIRDFRYLFASGRRKLNSSIMYFDTRKFGYVWDEFMKQPSMHMNQMPGDQDFIDRVIPGNQKQFFNESAIKSWRWQCFDGGYDTARRRHLQPGTGTCVEPSTRVMVFHGKPKLHEINDDVVKKYWG